MAIDDGGPAFPRGASVYDDMGMSLRDYMAGKALMGIMHDKTIWDATEAERRDIALRMYDFADAMIEARKVEK